MIWRSAWRSISQVGNAWCNRRTRLSLSIFSYIFASIPMLQMTSCSRSSQIGRINLSSVFARDSSGNSLLTVVKVSLICSPVDTKLWYCLRVSLALCNQSSDEKLLSKWFLAKIAQTFCFRWWNIIKQVYSVVGITGTALEMGLRRQGVPKPWSSLSNTRPLWSFFLRSKLTWISIVL